MFQGRDEKERESSPESSSKRSRGQQEEKEKARVPTSRTCRHGKPAGAHGPDGKRRLARNDSERRQACPNKEEKKKMQATPKNQIKADHQGIYKNRERLITAVGS